MTIAFRGFRSAGGLAVIAWAILGASAPVQAQTESQPVGAALTVVPGERLSDWILRNRGPNALLVDVHWRVDAERAPQGRLRQAVIAQLEAGPGYKGDIDGASQAELVRWVLSLPLTGRLTLASSDPRWLQAAPDQDPLLQVGQSVVLPPRPTVVTLLRPDGRLCQVHHSPGGLVADYLQSCAALNDPQGGPQWAWVVQPDGRVRRVGIALWNLSDQDEPAPGAWIWAPVPRVGIAADTSDNLARFLATQLPAESLTPQDPAMASEVRELVPSGVTAASLRPAQMSASDWGEIGLLQTPTARMEPAGNVRMQYTKVDPYGRLNVMLQRVDWMEAGFRYTSITNRLYGPEIAGDQAYVDKSLDVKLRLRQEDQWGPQVALGMRDIGGTGLFSGEYLVASRRWGNWDASLGLGWGYLGARGNVRAPLAFLGDSFRTRPVADVGQGGNLSTSTMFHGDAALIGGVQWQASDSRWLWKAELDGNDYRHEPLDNNQTATSPINVGASYRYSPNVDFSVGWERGTKLMLGMTLHAAFSEFESHKLLDPALPPVRATMPIVDVSPQYWQGTASALERFTGWQVLELGQFNDTAVLTAQTDGALFLQERVDKAVVLLHRDAPASVRYFVLNLREYGIALSEIRIDRMEWIARRTQPVPPSLKLPVQTVFPGTNSAQMPTASSLDNAFHNAEASATTVQWGPSYSQVLGGPNGFVLFELGAQANLEHRFSQDTWFSGAANARLLDNYSNFTYDAPSELPRVRTFAREYTTTSNITLPVAQLTHVKDLGHGNYLSAYGGMLESMYGGVGLEWLHRPWQGPVAFGIDVNHVRQRDFQQDLGFRDYEVDTGHATVYWDTGWDGLQVKFMAGRYLAGDSGVTLDIKRVFSNGVSMGLWATKTNVSAQQFGEGSFDKGIYVNIPFDVMLPVSSPGSASIVWDPLTRDGGARLNRQVTLFDLTNQRGSKAWSWNSRPLSGSDSRRTSANDTSYVLSTPETLRGNPFDLAGGVSRQIGDVPVSTWLWGGALVLASSALDSSADQWAQNHQSDKWQQLGAMANNVPYALALGAGFAWLGLAGDDMTRTAQTALVAGTYTLGVNLVTKSLVGRARPAEEMGPNSFNGGTSSAAQSSFASNHVALAFAFATPFAQQYDQPWLYGLAAFTGLGRIQSRDHWVSDTVAGGLIGYAIGTISSEQQRGNGRRVRLSATPNSVDATWSF